MSHQNMQQIKGDLQRLKELQDVKQVITALQGFKTDNERRDFANQIDNNLKESNKKMMDAAITDAQHHKNTRQISQATVKPELSEEDKKKEAQLEEEWQNTIKGLCAPDMAAYMEWTSGMMKIATACITLNERINKSVNNGTKDLLKKLDPSGLLNQFVDKMDGISDPGLSIITEDANGNLYIPPKLKATKDLPPFIWDGLVKSFNKSYGVWLEKHGYDINDDGQLVFAESQNKVTGQYLESFREKLLSSNAFTGFIPMLNNSLASANSDLNWKVSIASDPVVVPEPTTPAPR